MHHCSIIGLQQPNDWFVNGVFLHSKARQGGSEEDEEDEEEEDDSKAASWVDRTTGRCEGCKMVLCVRGDCFDRVPSASKLAEIFY